MLPALRVGQHQLLQVRSKYPQQSVFLIGGTICERFWNLFKRGKPLPFYLEKQPKGGLPWKRVQNLQKLNQRN